MNHSKIIMTAASDPKIQKLIKNQDILEWMDEMSDEDESKTYSEGEFTLEFLPRNTLPDWKGNICRCDVLIDGDFVLRLSESSSKEEHLVWTFKHCGSAYAAKYHDRVLAFLKYQTICTGMHTDLYVSPGRLWPYLE